MKGKYESYSDAKLTELLILEDTHAFEEIYNRYWAVLYSFALNKLKDNDQAKDVIQEAFTKLYEKMGGLYNESVKAYLYKSVQHLIINLYRHSEVRRQYITAYLAFHNQGEYITDYQVRENELKRQIEKEIENLPPKMRAIFEMSRKEYLSHKEIAERSGISEGTVKNTISYAVRKLRSKLTCLFFLQVMYAILWLHRKG